MKKLQSTRFLRHLFQDAYIVFLWCKRVRRQTCYLIRLKVWSRVTLRKFNTKLTLLSLTGTQSAALGSLLEFSACANEQTQRTSFRCFRLSIYQVDKQRTNIRLQYTAQLFLYTTRDKRGGSLINSSAGYTDNNLGASNSFFRLIATTACWTHGVEREVPRSRFLLNGVLRVS
jgi:hypothetical protein